MKMKLRHVASMLFIVFVVYHFATAVALHPTDHGRHQLSFAANTIRLKNFDKHGRLSSVIKADTIQHTTNNRAEFTNPQIINQHPAWTIQARHGKMVNQHTYVLYDHVRLHETQKATPITMTTKSLTYDAKQKRIYNNQPITIVKGSTTITANGIQVDLNKQALTLLAQVAVKDKDMILRAEQAVGFFDPKKLKKVILSRGRHPIFFQQKKANNVITANADSLTYHPQMQTLTLAGNATIAENQIKFQAEKIEYDIKDKKIVTPLNRSTPTEITFPKKQLTLPSMP